MHLRQHAGSFPHVGRRDQPTNSRGDSPCNESAVTAHGATAEEEISRLRTTNGGNHGPIMLLKGPSWREGAGAGAVGRAGEDQEAAFVAGFSERFVPELLRQVEDNALS